MAHVTGPALDRLEDRRGSDDALTPETRVLTFDPEAAAVLLGNGAEPRPAYTLAGANAVGEELVLLGDLDGVRWAARRAGAGEGAPEGVAAAGGYTSVRAAASALPAAEAGLILYGAGLLAWHRRSRHCGECGAATRATHAGHQRRCDGCGAVQFPRTDPAVITLVRRGERCLLINQPRWPEDRFAAVAGFVEPGESLEQAVAREVAEEVGLAVTGTEYLGSQPWPFPHTVMIAFRAVAADGPLVLGEEVRAARWFTRAELRGAVASGEVTLPTPFSISRSLVEDWLGAE